MSNCTPANIEELYPGAYLILGEVGGRPLSLPLLRGEENSILMDTGCAKDVDELILPAMEQIGMSPAELTHIIVTHCDVDHQGGNAAMKRSAPQAHFGCGRVVAVKVSDPAVIFEQRYDGHRAKHQHFYDADTRGWITESLGEAQPMDVLYDGGEQVELSPNWTVQLVKLPGHSKGHLAVWDAEHGALLAGDAIHGRVYLDTAGEPALCPTYLHVQPYLETITKIEAMRPKLFSGCHWPVYRDAEVQEFCAVSRAFVEQAEVAILDAIRASASGLTLSELCFAVGPKLGDWPEAVNHELCYAFNGHLEDLVNRGVLVEHTSAPPARYTIA